MSHETSDILIIGGGMAGGLLAALLADTGLRIQVLDGAPEPAWPTGEPELRVVAINEASYWLLHSVGAWQRLPEARVCTYFDMSVRDADGTGDLDFHADEARAQQLGWIIENGALVRTLFETCAEHPTIDWQCGQRVTGVQRGRDHWQATLNDGRVCSAPLVIGADGARSQVRDAAGIAAPTRETGHHALVCTLNTERAHQGCARQVFRDPGPVALLPLFGNGHQVSLVWSASAREVDTLMQLDDPALAHQLTTATAGWLGRLEPAGGRARFPVRESHASEYRGPGLALIGDAAHVVHPLAGQGINLGMLDAGVLAEEIRRGLDRGLTAADDTVLHRYQRRRRGHNGLMHNALRGFQFAFEQQAPVARFARNLGLNGLNRLAPVKGALARQALGREGDLPQRARPPEPTR